MKKTFSDEDLVKNLSLYYLNQHLKKKPIGRYHDQIDQSALHEREKYKKKSEILLLNAFMHHFPQIHFENLTCESPDFIATFNGKKLGIELTEVINHLEMKKIEGILNKLFRQAEIQLEKENTAKFRGVYFLQFRENLEEHVFHNYDKLLADICKSVQKQKPFGCVKTLKKSHHRRNVFITHDYTQNLFDTLCSEKILELIQKKNLKFPFYDQSVDEHWLVMVSNMNSLASRYSIIQNKENLNAIQSPFHKIVHLENLCGNMTYIK